jgi:hypothetical protein
VRKRAEADVRRALIRALGQLTTAVEESEELDDRALTGRLETLRDAVSGLARELER